MIAKLNLELKRETNFSDQLGLSKRPTKRVLAEIRRILERMVDRGTVDSTMNTFSSKLVILVSRVSSFGIGAVLLHYSLRSLPSAHLAVMEKSFSRDSEDFHKSELVLNLTNRTMEPIQILGISRTDCGNRSISEEPPFRLDCNQSRNIVVGLITNNPHETYTVPVVIFTNKSPNFIDYNLRIEGLAQFGVPTLAPDVPTEVEPQ